MEPQVLWPWSHDSTPLRLLRGPTGHGCLQGCIRTSAGRRHVHKIFRMTFNSCAGVKTNIQAAFLYSFFPSSLFFLNKLIHFCGFLEVPWGPKHDMSNDPLALAPDPPLTGSPAPARRVEWSPLCSELHPKSQG